MIDTEVIYARIIMTPLILVWFSAFFASNHLIVLWGFRYQLPKRAKIKIWQ